MAEFARKLPKTQVFTFGVCTCGGDAAHAITLQDGKPVWAAQCCLHCINECPQRVIQYGKSTAGRRRYIIPGHLPQDEQF